MHYVSSVVAFCYLMWPVTKYLGYTSHCLSCGGISTICSSSGSWNDRKDKYIFLFSKTNSERQWLNYSSQWSCQPDVVLLNTPGQVINHRTTVRVLCVLLYVFVNVKYLEIYRIISRYVFSQEAITDQPFAYEQTVTFKMRKSFRFKKSIHSRLHKG